MFNGNVEMQLWMVETQLRGDSSATPWYLITEQQTPGEAVRFARRWLRQNWGEVMTVREPCAAYPLDEFPSWVVHYQRRVWERNDLSRKGNARVTNVSTLTSETSDQVSSQRRGLSQRSNEMAALLERADQIIADPIYKC